MNLLPLLIIRARITAALSLKRLLLKNGDMAIVPSVTLVLMILCFISACTTTAMHSSKSTSEPDSSPTQQQLLDNLAESWTANGRISVINGQENWYAKFIWVQKKQDFQLSFTGPLGETELQISQINEHVRLKTPSEERSSHDLEQLLEQQTGWVLPIKSLRFWSQGSPDPGMSSRLKYDKRQQISDIFQAGWHIQYPKRMPFEQLSGSGILLPKKIIATRQDIKIKLIITRWHLGESTFSLHKQPVSDRVND